MILAAAMPNIANLTPEPSSTEMAEIETETSSATESELHNEQLEG